MGLCHVAHVLLAGGMAFLRQSLLFFTLTPEPIIPDGRVIFHCRHNLGEEELEQTYGARTWSVT